jgi:hypothetical protein
VFHRLNVLLKNSQSCAACAVLSMLVFVGFVFVRIGTDPTGSTPRNFHDEPAHTLILPSTPVARLDSASEYHAQRSDQIQRFYVNATFQTATASSPYTVAGQPFLGSTYTTRLPDRFISRDSVVAGSYMSTDLDDE